jgi:hypothetical protein
MTTLKRPQLHATGLNMACGEAFRRRYIEGEIIPPGVAAIVGIATDRAVSRNLEHKRETHELLPVEEVADVARDSLSDAWDRGGVRLEPEEVETGIPAVKGQAADKTVRLSVLHATATAPSIEPTHIQRQWAIEIPGYPFDLVGTLDIQEGGAAVRDTKTTAKTPPADTAEKSLQLSAYSLAVKVLDGNPPEKVKLDYLVDNKTPKAVTLEATRTDEDYRALLARIETVSLAIERGVFVPVSPDHWACSERFCGYARTCRYFIRRPHAVAVTQGEL